MIDESKLIYNFEFIKKYGADISGGMPDNATAMEEICRRVYNKGWMDCKAELGGKDTNVPSKWIPVSESSPEERGNYLATIKVEAGTFVIYVWFGEEGWIDGYSEPINVIAWMPLPPAFVEGDKE